MYKIKKKLTIILFLLYRTEIPPQGVGFGGFLRDYLLVYGKVLTLKNFLSAEIPILVTRMIMMVEVTKTHSIRHFAFIQILSNRRAGKGASICQASITCQQRCCLGASCVISLCNSHAKPVC